MTAVPTPGFAHTEEAAFVGDQIPDPELPWWEAHDAYARAVAIDGNTAVVAAGWEAGGYSGAVYVYTRNPDGTWVREDKIVTPMPVFNFGRTVAIHGDTILVTALEAGDYQGTGYAYIFVRDNGSWSLQQSLFGESNDMDGFGYAGAIHGDTAVVTAWHDDDMGNNAGAAHVFARDNGVWTREAKLYASDGVSPDHFGRAVDVEGDTLAVNSMLDFNPAGLYAGNAYVFVRKDGNWVEQAKLEAADGQGADNLGNMLKINRNFIIAGALGDDADDGTLNSGSAYVFRRQQCTWTQDAKLEPDSGHEGMFFGSDVAIQGKTALVSAPYADVSGASSGTVYVYTRSSGVWSQHSQLQPADAAAGMSFGLSLGLADDKAVIGATAGLQGKVYMFDLSTDSQAWAPQTDVCYDGCHP